VEGALERGALVFIAGAGMSAALPGFVASLTTRPVIGVPIASGLPGGIDALLAIAGMPPGVPVATVAVGKAGARNAAILAAEILAISDGAVAKRLEEMRTEWHQT
jgi:5-(carboxyamino)imidazole ribonucleotide mutase